MTLDEFLANPAGSGDVALNMSVIKSNLDSKYEKLISNPDKKIKLTIFKVLNRENYYFLMEIPTETERGNSYDVVIQLIGSKEKAGKSISSYDCKFFSNSPAFGYTNAKVYKDNDLLVRCLYNKFDSEMLSKRPVVRNRYGIIGYDKYLYFGAKYLNEARLFSRAELHFKSIRFSEPVFTSKVRSIDVILREYHTAERKMKNKRGKSNPPSKKLRSAADNSNTSTSSNGNHVISTKNKNSHRVSKRRYNKKKI